MNETENPQTLEYNLKEPEQRCRDEYKALRDEMVMLFNRTFVIFAVEVTAAFTLAWRMIESEKIVEVLLIALAAQIIAAIGLILSLHLYNHIYSIGSYILVFLEGASEGWTLRSRHFQIPPKLTDNSLQFKLSFDLKWHEKLNEPKTIGYCYLFFILTFFILPLFMQFKLVYGTPLSQLELVGLAIGVAIGVFLLASFNSCVLYKSLSEVYSKGARRSMKKWYEYQKFVLDLTTNNSIQEPVDFMFNKLIESLDEDESKKK